MKPLRPSLLNAQISLEARRIAHAATKTCKGALLPNVDEHHTRTCNRVKDEIENLALVVKWQSIAPPLRSNEKPPDFEWAEQTDA